MLQAMFEGELDAQNESDKQTGSEPTKQQQEMQKLIDRASVE